MYRSSAVPVYEPWFVNLVRSPGPQLAMAVCGQSHPIDVILTKVGLTSPSRKEPSVG